MRAPFAACLVGLALVGPGCDACEERRTGPPGVRFTPVDEGVEYARFRVAGKGERPGFDGHAFRVDLQHVGLRVLPAGGPTVHRNVKTITRALDPVIAVNGSFFDPKKRPMGLVVDQGRLISKRRARAWGALVVKDRRAWVTGGREVDLQQSPSLVVQGQPRLVNDGEVARLKPQSAERTVLCLDEGSALEGGGFGRITFVVTTAVDATALAHFLAAPEDEGGMGCTEALNLDGGPSTQLVARLGALRVEIEGDDVPNALAAMPGLPERQTTSGPPADGGPPPDAGGR